MSKWYNDKKFVLAYFREHHADEYDVVYLKHLSAVDVMGRHRDLPLMRFYVDGRLADPCLFGKVSLPLATKLLAAVAGATAAAEKSGWAPPDDQWHGPRDRWAHDLEYVSKFFGDGIMYTTVVRQPGPHTQAVKWVKSRADVGLFSPVNPPRFVAEAEHVSPYTLTEVAEDVRIATAQCGKDKNKFWYNDLKFLSGFFCNWKPASPGLTVRRTHAKKDGDGEHLAVSLLLECGSVSVSFLPAGRPIVAILSATGFDHVLDAVVGAWREYKEIHYKGIIT